MDFETLCIEYLEAQKSRSGQAAAFLEDARKLFRRKDGRDEEWLRSALEEEERKFFAAAVLTPSVPGQFLRQMIRAGILEPNPSRNREFIDPCLRSYGATRVRQVINDLQAEGAVEEGSGIENAMYWVKTFSAEFSGG